MRRVATALGRRRWSSGPHHRADALGLRLSPAERQLLSQSAPKYETALWRSVRGAHEKEHLVALLAAGEEHRPGHRALKAIDFLGTGLFSVVGTVAAGEAGMNAVGCGLVGCVAAMGGGTVNSLLMGTAGAGVFWVRDPRYLALALGCSLATFFGWPRLQAYEAEQELARMEPDAQRRVSLAGFEAGLRTSPWLLRRLQQHVARELELPAGGPALTSRQLFEHLDTNKDNYLSFDEILWMVTPLA